MSVGRFFSKLIIGPICERSDRYGRHYLPDVLPQIEISPIVFPLSSSACHFLILFDESEPGRPSKVIWTSSAEEAQDLACHLLPLSSQYRCEKLSYQETYSKLAELLLEPFGQWEKGSMIRKEAFDCAERLGHYCLSTAEHLTKRGLVRGQHIEGGPLALNDLERKVSLTRQSLHSQADFWFSYG